MLQTKSIALLLLVSQSICALPESPKVDAKRADRTFFSLRGVAIASLVGAAAYRLGAWLFSAQPETENQPDKAHTLSSDYESILGKELPDEAIVRPLRAFVRKISSLKMKQKTRTKFMEFVFLLHEMPDESAQDELIKKIEDHHLIAPEVKEKLIQMIQIVQARDTILQEIRQCVQARGFTPTHGIIQEAESIVLKRPIDEQAALDFSGFSPQERDEIIENLIALKSSICAEESCFQWLMKKDKSHLRKKPTRIQSLQRNFTHR